MDCEHLVEGTNTMRFDFQPQHGGTEVTWSLVGRHNLLGKVAGLIMNCEQRLGRQFAHGLENLRAVVEPPPSAPWRSTASVFPRNQA